MGVSLRYEGMGLILSEAAGLIDQMMQSWRDLVVTEKRRRIRETE